MRPDTRSFSFTWLRGQQHQEELSLGRPTTRSQAVSKPAHSYENMETDDDSAPEEDLTRELPQKKCTTGRLKLRRFGTSFLRNITNTGDAKYNSIEEEEVNEDKAGNAGCDAKESERNYGIDQTPSTSKSTLSIGKRLNKTVQDVKSTLGNIGQVHSEFSIQSFVLRLQNMYELSLNFQ